MIDLLMETVSPTIAIMFEMLGPYHVARINAFAANEKVVALEGSQASDTYDWDSNANADQFRRVTLFHDAPIVQKSPKEVREKIFAVLSEHRPDVVVVPGWASSYAYSMLAWASANNAPAVVMSASQATDYPRVQWREWIKRRVVRSFSAAVAGGGPQAAYLELLGMPKERIFVGYDVVDNDHFAQGAARARANADQLRRERNLPEKYFLATARFVNAKNLPRLIEAYARYREAAGAEAWSLVLLGDGHLRGSLEEQIARAGLTEHVLMPGFKQYDDLPIYYGLAGAFVHVSATEQWGLVVNEAMAAGLPVIVSTRCGCVHDLVEDGANGFIVDHRDVGAIIFALKSIAAPDCDRAAMRRRSEEIIARWSPQTFAEGLRRAVDIALRKPAPQLGFFDRTLMWALRRAT